MEHAHSVPASPAGSCLLAAPGASNLELDPFDLEGPALIPAACTCLHAACPPACRGLQRDYVRKRGEAPAIEAAIEAAATAAALGGDGEEARMLQGLDLVMRTYEREMQRPLRNLVGGELVRALLIQVRCCCPLGCSASVRAAGAASSVRWPAWALQPGWPAAPAPCDSVSPALAAVWPLVPPSLGAVHSPDLPYRHTNPHLTAEPPTSSV